MNYYNIKSEENLATGFTEIMLKNNLYQISKKEVKLGWDRKNRSHSNELQMSKKESFRKKEKYGIYKNKKKFCTFWQISLKFLCPGNHDKHFPHWTPVLFLRPILSAKTFYKANFKTIYEKGIRRIVVLKKFGKFLPKHLLKRRFLSNISDWLRSLQLIFILFIPGSNALKNTMFSCFSTPH